MSSYHHPAETLRTETFRATISNSFKSTKSPNDHYAEVYDYISSNPDDSLDLMMDHCTCMIGCSKETFSRAVQVYILTQN